MSCFTLKPDANKSTVRLQTINTSKTNVKLIVGNIWEGPDPKT